MKRRALLRGGAGLALCAPAAGCLGPALTAVNGRIFADSSESHLHDASVRYVGDGLDADSESQYALRFFTSKPADVVANSAPEEGAESLRRTLGSTDYDRFFLVLLEARMPFEERFFLGTTPSVDAEWTGWLDARVPFVQRSADGVLAGDVGGADELVCTTLAAFETDVAPASVTVPVYDRSGGVAATLRA